jgi:cation diffusion facilitator CzcD-associated flavoprotein CzcO
MQDNVELVSENIEKFTPNGIKTKDGVERSFDLIVLGCGFRPTEYLYPVQYVGRNGVTLDKTWAKDGARSYVGLVILIFSPCMVQIINPAVALVCTRGLRSGVATPYRQ